MTDKSPPDRLSAACSQVESPPASLEEHHLREEFTGGGVWRVRAEFALQGPSMAGEVFLGSVGKVRRRLSPHETLKP